MLQGTGDEVVVAGDEVELHLWQTAAQAGLVYLLVGHLALHLVDERGDGIDEILIAAVGMEVEVEVVAVDDGTCGVAVGEDVHDDIIGAVVLGAFAEGDIGERALGLIELLQVGGYVDLSADGDVDGVFDESQALEVGMGKVAGESGLDELRRGEGVDADEPFEELVAAVGVNDEVPAAQSGRDLDVVEVVGRILQAVYVGSGVECGVRGSEVGALSPGRYRSRERMDGLPFEEVADGEAAGRKLGGIGHTPRVQTDIAT